MKLPAIAAVVLTVLSVSGFSEQATTGVASEDTQAGLFAQPASERKAQDALPKAAGSMWDTLTSTKVTADMQKGLYKATFPDAVKKLAGTTVKIDGFMLPLESTEKFKHFLLSLRTPTCFFCPPGAPNEIVEVYSEKPTEWAEDLVTYQGKFTLIDNEELGVFFKMTDAVQVANAK